MPTKRQARRTRAARRLVPPHATDTEVETPSDAPAAPAAEPRAAAITSHRLFPVAGLAALYLVTAVVCAVVASKQAIPNLFPDELFYGKLAQGRGGDPGLPPLWPSLLSLVWHGSVPDGYAAAKTLGAFVVATTVVPVWLLARRYMSDLLALAPAALAVLGVWMQVSDFIVSENLAYPLATASLALTVIAVEDMRLRWIFGSLAFAALATATRTQMLVLPVILVVALVLDVARQPRGERRARIAARPRGLWIGLGAAVLTGLLAFIVKPSLTNYDVLAHHPSLGKVISTTIHEGTGALALFVFVPVVATVALMARRANWRDERLGPLLVTIAAAAICLVPLAGRFLAWATGGIPVDRYVMYLAPLLLIALFAAPGRIGRRAALIAAVAVGAAMILQPDVDNFLEQGGVYGVQRALFDNGLSRDHFELATIVVALAAGLLGALALTSKRRPHAGLAAAAALCACLMLAQNWAARSYEHRYAETNRVRALPAQMDWVDRNAAGPVGLLDVANKSETPQAIFTDFFNRKIKSSYSTSGAGKACEIDIADSGAITQTDKRCAAWPRTWVLADGPVTPTLRGQEIVTKAGRAGTLVRVPDGAPRIQSLVAPPCTEFGCTGQFDIGLYLDQPSDVAVVFGPGSVDHRIQAGGSRIQQLPAGQPATLRLKLPAGPQAGRIFVDWNDPAGAPPLQSVVVKSGGETLRVY